MSLAPAPEASVSGTLCPRGKGWAMGFGFRVGVPGMSVRVSTRGVRTSVGPRAARLSVGSGGTRVSTGLGPFYASSSLSGSRRRTTTRRTTHTRSVAPSAAQLERARRQAERAQQEAERDTAIAQLQELRRQMTSVHLQSFATAQPPDPSHSATRSAMGARRGPSLSPAWSGPTGTRRARCRQTARPAGRSGVLGRGDGTSTRRP